MLLGIPMRWFVKTVSSWKMQILTTQCTLLYWLSIVLLHCLVLVAHCYTGCTLYWLHTVLYWLSIVLYWLYIVLYWCVHIVLYWLHIVLYWLYIAILVYRAVNRFIMGDPFVFLFQAIAVLYMFLLIAQLLSNLGMLTMAGRSTTLMTLMTLMANDSNDSNDANDTKGCSPWLEVQPF